MRAASWCQPGWRGSCSRCWGWITGPRRARTSGLSKEAAAPSSNTPLQVAQAYQFPAGTDGTGQTIAILEFGGGFPASDLQSYCSGLGLPVLSVKAAGVDGASNAPGSDPSGADGEVILDIEVAGSVAPGATQVVHFGPNTDQAFVDAIRRLGRAGRGGQRGPCSTSQIRLRGLTWLVTRRADTR